MFRGQSFSPSVDPSELDISRRRPLSQPAPIVAQITTPDQLRGTGQYCRCTFFGHATPDRTGARPGARPYRVQCRVARCDIGDRWPAPDLLQYCNKSTDSRSPCHSHPEARQKLDAVSPFHLSLLTFHPLSRAPFLRQAATLTLS